MLDYDEIANKISPNPEELEDKITKTVLSKLDSLIGEKTVEINPEIMEKRITELLEKKVEKALSAKQEEEEEDNLSALIKTLIEQKIKDTNTLPMAAGSTPHPNEQVSPRSYMRNTVVNVTSELKEKEKRMNNLIVYGIKESRSQDIQERKNHDMTEFLKTID